MEILVFKHIQNRFYFSKTKDFLDQRLISEHMQAPVSKCTFPEKIQTRRDEKGRVPTLEKNPRIFGLVTLPLEIPEKAKLRFWIFRKVVWCGTPWKFEGEKPRPMEIPLEFFLITAGNSTSF